MRALCLLAIALAVLLAVPPHASRSISARLSEGSRSDDSVRRRAGPIVLAGVTCALLVGAGAGLAGPSGAVVAASAAIAFATVARLVGRRRHRVRAARRRLQVARGCAAIASQVRVGRVPSEALSAAAEDWTVLATAEQVQKLGGDVPEALLARAGRPGCDGLADLARAWQLSADTGAPMASTLDQVALSLRRDEAMRRTVAAELAGPRATGKVMAVLPLGGIGMGYVLGGSPIAFLVESPVGWACLLGGVALACAGVVWVDHLARVAEDA